MPAAHERCRMHGRPASESLQGKKPRERVRGRCGALYGEPWYRYAFYDVLLPLWQRYAGKDEAHVIERDNARQRTDWLVSVGSPSWSRRPGIWVISLAVFACCAHTTGSATSYLALSQNPALTTNDRTKTPAMALGRPKETVNLDSIYKLCQHQMEIVR